MASGLGIVQAGMGAASLLGGGGTTTQYVPTYDAMNEVLMSSVDIQSEIYKNQMQLTNDAFSTNLGLGDAEYKRLITQLVNDKSAQQNQLMSEAIQNQALTQQAELTLEMGRYQQTFEQEAQKLVANQEYTNTIDTLRNNQTLREMSSINRQNQYNLDIGNIQRQGKDIQAGYDLMKKGQGLERDKLNLEYQGLSTQERNLMLAKDKAGLSYTNDVLNLENSRKGVDNQKMQQLNAVESQRQNLMYDFLSKENKDIRALANRVAQMSSNGNVDTQGITDTANRNSILNPDDFNVRQQANAQMGTQIGLANNAARGANEQLDAQGQLSNQAYQQQLQQLGLQGEGINQARQGLGVQDSQMGLNNQQAELQYQAAMNQNKGQLGSLMNTNMQNVINQDLAPYLQAQLAQRQADQRLNLQQKSGEVGANMSEYGYDLSKLGINYSKQQDAQALADYMRMIDSQYAMNSQAANASYLTGLGNAYAQNASQQSQLGSAYSGGINQIASQVQNTPRMQTSGGGGFNWQGLGQLASQGYGLLSGGGSSQPANNYSLSNQTLPRYDASLYQPVGNSYSGFFN
jgi:hypothetical protein